MSERDHRRALPHDIAEQALFEAPLTFAEHRRFDTDPEWSSALKAHRAQLRDVVDAMLEEDVPPAVCERVAARATTVWLHNLRSHELAKLSARAGARWND